MEDPLSADGLGRLTTSPPGHWSRYPAAIVDRDGHCCLSWYRYPPPDSGLPCQIWFARGGGGFASLAAAEPVRVTRDDRNHTGAALCQDGAGTYHLAWHCWPQRVGERFLLFSRSRDGREWAQPERPLPQLAEYMIYPSLACHPSGRLWLSFSAGLGREAGLFIASSDDGRSWESPTPFPVGRAGDNKGSLCAMPDGGFLMVWKTLAGDGYVLSWSVSPDGVTWREPKGVALAAQVIDRPKVALDRHGAPWLTYEGDGCLWLSRFDPESGWALPRKMETGASVESRPSALVQDAAGEFWVAWTSQRAGTDIWTAKFAPA